jgi:hypothetical protein
MKNRKKKKGKNGGPKKKRQEFRNVLLEGVLEGHFIVVRKLSEKLKKKPPVESQKSLFSPAHWTGSKPAVEPVGWLLRACPWLP